MDIGVAQVLSGKVLSGEILARRAEERADDAHGVFARAAAIAGGDNNVEEVGADAERRRRAGCSGCHGIAVDRDGGSQSGDGRGERVVAHGPRHGAGVGFDQCAKTVRGESALVEVEGERACLGEEEAEIRIGGVQLGGHHGKADADGGGCRDCDLGRHKRTVGRRGGKSERRAVGVRDVVVPACPCGVGVSGKATVTDRQAGGVERRGVEVEEIDNASFVGLGGHRGRLVVPEVGWFVRIEPESAEVRVDLRAGREDGAVRQHHLPGKRAGGGGIRQSRTRQRFRECVIRVGCSESRRAAAGDAIGHGGPASVHRTGNRQIVDGVRGQPRRVGVRAGEGKKGGTRVHGGVPVVVPGRDVVELVPDEIRVGEDDGRRSDRVAGAGHWLEAAGAGHEGGEVGVGIDECDQRGDAEAVISQACID